MKNTIKLLVASLFFSSPLSVYATDYLANRVYSVSVSETPHRNEIVNQNTVKKIPSYTGGWYFCAQASWATVFNILRTDRNANHVNQLEYFHNKLMKYGSYANDPHKQGDGDDLREITNARSDFSVTKESQTDRGKIKSLLHKALISNSKQLPVVLSQRRVGGKDYGHFYVVYKVSYNSNGKSTVYFADPYTGSTSSADYSVFLNGMKDAGTKGRYSFWIIKKS